MSGGVWGQIAAAAIDIGGELYNAHNQRRANAQNIKLAREQMAWEEEMSNTAIQRRAADIEAAGGNRALAFTTGSEASTPTYSRADVESPKVNFQATGKAISMLQAQNIAANTRATNAQAQGQEIRNNIDNVFAPQIAAINLDIKETQKQMAAKEYDLLEQQIKNAVETELNLRATRANTGAQTKKLEAELEQNIKLLMQQVRMGQIDLDAAENIAKIFGQEAGKMTGVTQTILQVMQEFFSNRKRK